MDASWTEHLLVQVTDGASSVMNAAEEARSGAFDAMNPNAMLETSSADSNRVVSISSFSVLSRSAGNVPNRHAYPGMYKTQLHPVGPESFLPEPTTPADDVGIYMMRPRIKALTT